MAPESSRELSRFAADFYGLGAWGFYLTTFIILLTFSVDAISSRIWRVTDFERAYFSIRLERPIEFRTSE
jgi:hypothetical protein